MDRILHALVEYIAQTERQRIRIETLEWTVECMRGRIGYLELSVSPDEHMSIRMVSPPVYESGYIRTTPIVFEMGACNICLDTDELHKCPQCTIRLCEDCMITLSDDNDVVKCPQCRRDTYVWDWIQHYNRNTIEYWHSYHPWEIRYRKMC